MTVLNLIMAPNPIFKKKSEPVEQVDDNVRNLMDNLLETLYHEEGIGIAAPMVGVLKRVIVIDMRDEQGRAKQYLMANPIIVETSAEIQVFEEASLCFLGIGAPIERPREIKVKFLNYHNEEDELDAEGFLATVIQHEIDYLDGVTFLDHISPLKRNMLLKKMEKFKKNYKPHHHHHAPHVHGPHCNHGHHDED